MKLKLFKTDVFVMFMLLCMAQPAWSIRLPVNADNDAIADSMELWLIKSGVTQDDSANPISTDTQNTYNDTDGDSIPDIIENNLTKTDPAVSDLAPPVCNGNGALNYSGQRALRIFSTGVFSSTHDLLTQYLSVLSICHTDTFIRAYNPEIGYSNDSLSSLINGNLNLVWDLSEGNQASLIATNVTTASANLAGNLVITEGVNQVSLPIRSSQQALSVSLDEISGQFGVQTKTMNDNGPRATAINSVLNPGSRAVQVLANPSGNEATPTSVVVYTHLGVLPGYYVPSTGSMFVASVDMLEGVEQTAWIRAIYFQSTQSRGEMYFQWNDGVSVEEQYENFYAVADTPNMTVQTFVRPNRTNSRIHLFNVPFAADMISLSGPNGFAHTYIDMSDEALRYDSQIIFRNRWPGFTDNPDVGVSANNHNISQLMYQPASSDTVQIVPDGAYMITGSIGGEVVGTVSYTYTAPVALAQNYAVPDNVIFDGNTWQAGTPLTLVNVNQAHSISFSHASSGSTNQYRLAIFRSDDGELNDFDATRLFKFSSNCCSFTLDAGVLIPDVDYCATIMTRHSENSQLRAMTDQLCFSTTANNSVPNPPPGNGGDSNNSGVGGGGGGGAGAGIALLLMCFRLWLSVRVKNKKAAPHRLI